MIKELLNNRIYTDSPYGKNYLLHETDINLIIQETRKELIEEVKNMINDIKLTNPDYAYSNDYIDDFLTELKQELNKLKEK